MSTFAYTTYQKTLVELRFCLRASHFDHELFINNMKLIDETIIDMCPIIDMFEKHMLRNLLIDDISVYNTTSQHK